jgi:hypothetical protein
MKKRKKKSIKSHTLISPLDAHKRQRKKLITPFNAMNEAIGNKIAFQSWIEQRLPDLLWASICRKVLGQEAFIRLGHEILDLIYHYRDKLADNEAYVPTHTNIAKWEPAVSSAFVDLVAARVSPGSLTSLLLVECLPDYAIWRNKLKALEPKDWKELSIAVLEVLNHQSQSATDIRWLVVCSAIAADKFRAAQNLIEELKEYPNKGDQRRVRPFVRATEMGFRSDAFRNDTSKDVEKFCDDFWASCYEKTPCMPVRMEDAGARIYEFEDKNQIQDVYLSVVEHINKVRSDTALDAKADSVAGLALYAVYLLWSMSVGRSDRRVEGRLILRAIFEVLVTLTFLRNSVDPKIWMKYRSFGSGQAKLFFLKMDSTSLPEYVSADEIEMYVNEDFWIEYQDIDFGAWSGKPLRAMCEELDLMPLYDRYYIWTSGYIHSHWIAIRDTLYTVCANPLHRLHRIPVQPRFDMRSTLADGAKLLNLILNEVDKIFPGYTKRVKVKEKIANA